MIDFFVLSIEINNSVQHDFINITFRLIGARAVFPRILSSRMLSGIVSVDAHNADVYYYTLWIAGQSSGFFCSMVGIKPQPPVLTHNSGIQIKRGA